MCGRFYLDVPADELTRHFGLEVLPVLQSRYNIAPSQPVAAVLSGSRGRELRMFRWGLIPFWAKDEKIGYRTINARAETVDSKPAFRAALRHRRCLIPASGFYEWRPGPAGKQPYCIHLKQRRLFAFAGLYEHWQDSTGKAVDSCTILVTQANSSIKPIHERMPVILSPDNYSAWLDPHTKDPALLKPLLQPAPADEIDLYAVSKRVNSPKYDDPGCLAPLS
jgi:putative SOS response-associated peptidase YedK